MTNISCLPKDSILTSNSHLVVRKTIVQFFLSFLFLGVVFSPSDISAQTVFFTEDFETDGTGVRYTANDQFIDGLDGSVEDFYGRIDHNAGAPRVTDLPCAGVAAAEIDITNPFSGHNGNFYMAGEDMNDSQASGGCGTPNTGTPVRSVIFTGINISGSSAITGRILVANGADNLCGTNSSRWDAGEGLKVLYSVDGGTSIEALCFAPNLECNIPGDNTNEPLNLDLDCDGDGEDGFVSNVFTEYTFSIPAGGSAIDLTIAIDADAGDEEIAFDYVRLEAVTPPGNAIVCPTIGAVTVTGIPCTNSTFDVTATGLANMDMASNMDQDYGITFVAHPIGSTLDPYIGGIVLGTVPFGGLTGGGTTATILGASISVATAYEIYALLSPTPTNATCRPSAVTNIGVVAPTPVMLTIPAGQDVACVDDPAYTISMAGSPSSGSISYSGPGVTDLLNGDFSFNPAVAGIGMHTVTFTYTDVCTSTATDIIEVFDVPTVTFTALADLCLNDGVQDGFGGSPTGGVYSGPGVVDAGDGMNYDFDPAVAGVGTHTITYTFTDANTCTNSATDDVQVFAVPTAAFTAPADTCESAGVQTGLSGGTPTGGVYSGAGVTDDGNGMTYSFDPAAAGVGVHTITYTVGVSGCSDSAIDDVEVTAPGTASLETSLYYCLDAPIANIALVGGSPAGGVYSGTGVTDLGNGVSYNLDPMVSGVGTLTVTYTVMDANGCVASAMSDIEIIDCGSNISDPCACLDNATIFDCDAGTGGDDGQFSEIVTVTGAAGPLPNGMIWTVVGATGALDGFNVPPVGTQSAGVPVAIGTLLMFNAGVYEIPFVHVDDIGYTLMIEGPFGAGSPANVTLTISNKCAYPDPVFDPALAAMYNMTDPAFALGGMDSNGGTADGVTFTIDGGAAVMLDPSALALGNHTAVMTYDGADDGNGGISPDGGTTAALPGCTQEVQKVFEIVNCDLVVDCSAVVDAPLECRADLPPTDLTLPVVTQSCGVATTSVLTIIPGNTGCPGDPIVITRTYTVTDDAGNMVECMQTFTVMSAILPTVTCPANVMVACGSNTMPAATGMATGTASCSAAVITFSDVSTQMATGCMAHEYMITRTWTATDDCNRTATCDQIINVIDGVDPVFDQAVLPVGGTFECDAVPAAETLTASDNCGGAAPTLFVNEFHYDDAGTDANEFLEIAGSTGIDLSAYSVYAYEGSDGMFDATFVLAGVIPDEGAGFGAIAFDRSFLTTGFFENGAADGIALVEVATGMVVQFISYEGTVSATNGPAMGMTSTDVGVAEGGGTADTESIQLLGSGCSIGDFTWNGPATASPGLINTGQTFDASACATSAVVEVVFTENFVAAGCPNEGTLTRTWTATDDCGNSVVHTIDIILEDNTPPTICDAPMSVTLSCSDPIPPAPVVTAFDNCSMASGIWVNEFHYDNTGGDVGEFVEVAGPAGTDLTGYNLEVYNGANGSLFSTTPITGIIPAETCGYGAVAIMLPANGLMNGAPDGFAIVDPAGNVIEFLSYEGSFTAAAGSAIGLTSTDVLVSEPGTTPVGQSLQLTGTGNMGSAFTWTGPAAESPGALNTDQILQGEIIATLVEVTTPGACVLEMTITRTWTATDACGNESMSEQVITVADSGPPMAVCVDVTIELDENGMASLIDAAGGLLIDGGSSDDCTAVDDLIISASRTEFSCLDINPGTLPGCEATFEVTMTVTDLCGKTSMCIANVTVQDNIAPTLTCPGSAIFNLDAGECGVVFNYVDPFAVDNCEGVMGTTFLGTTFIDNNGFAGNMFDITNVSAMPITVTMFDIHLTSAAGTMHEAEVWYTTTAGTYAGNETDAAAWTSLGSSMVTAAGPGMPSALPVGGLTIDPGVSYGIYVAQIDGGADIDYTNGNATNNFYTDGTIELDLGVGKGNPVFTGGTFNPRIWNGNVHYEFLTGNTTTVTQVSGPATGSGEFYTEGTYTWTYQADDGCGNISECSWTLEVNAFPETLVSSTLVCNGGVNVSLDATCQACITADMLLEGGPYRCYDEYIVGSNGPGTVVPATFGSGTYLCFDASNIGQTIEVSVTDPVTGNSCWGYATVEDKLAPVITGCDDITITCIDQEFGLIDIMPTVTDCSDFILDFSDDGTVDQCTNGTIIRTYIAQDIYGNSDTCTASITIERISLADITLPPGIVTLPGCGSEGTFDDIIAEYDDPTTTDNPLTPWIENNEGFPFAYPTYLVEGHPQPVLTDNVCGIKSIYSDQVVASCGGACGMAQKVIRTWTLIDWCTTEQVEFTQIIDAIDNEAPTIEAADLTVSTDPWGCVAFITPPAPTLLHDNCSSNLTWTVSGPSGWDIFGLDKSVDADGDGIPDPHVFTYTAEDCCGNFGSTTINVTVLDQAPPVVNAKHNIIMSLTAIPGQGNEAAAKLFNYHVDNGSYDGCGGIKVEIRRPTGSSCGNLGTNNYNNNATFNDDFGHLGDNASDTDNGEFVKFCCADAAGNLDTLPSGDVISYGLHEVIMRVYDDANMDFIPGNLGDNYNETWVWVRVENKLPPIINCTDATLECYEDATVIEEVDAATGAKTYTSVNTPLPTTSGVCANVCFVLIGDSDLTGPCGDGTIIRTWGIDGNCDGNVDGATCTQFITVSPSTDVFTGPVNFPADISTNNCANIYSPVKPNWTDGICDLVGWTHEDEVFEIEPGACFKIIRTFTVINWCTGQEWVGEQEIKYVDDTAPEMTCVDQCFPGDALDANGDALCGRFVSLTKTAVDTLSSCNSDWLDWYVTVDLWSDGTIDWIFTTSQQANVNSLDNILPIPGSNTTVSINIPEFIANSCYDHTVVWTANDKCNNVVACTELFQVEDKKAPTPYCVSVSSALMEDPDGAGPLQPMVTLWAKDFNIGAFDDCTAQEDLMFTFSALPPAQDSHFDPNENSSYGEFNQCGDQLVRIFVWDDACTQNFDFCQVMVNIGGVGCTPTGTSRIGGSVSTEVGDGVEDVNMSLESDDLVGALNTITDTDGNYAFNAVTDGIGYSITGEKNDDYMNGVSTLDLVLIQKHILGLRPLDSPYKMIAADINYSMSITAIDLVELRKLILGIYDELPSNDSWRFVDEDQNLMTNNPWNYVEEVFGASLQNERMEEDFIGVKVGDVNGSVTANVASITTESRTENNLTLEVEALDLEAGETTTIEVLSSNFTDVYGYQMTMNVEGMTINSVEGVSLELTDANVSVMSDRMTMSYHSSKSVTASKDEVLFTMNVTATQSGSLSTMMNINSTVTKAEAYFGNDLNVGNVELGVRGDAGVTVVDGYELFQNEPNPFKGSTQISFRMAESSSATITVYDVTGKVISVNTEVCPKGYNTVSYNKSDLGSVSGVLYYQLESGDFMATKKMIVIE